MAVAKLLFRFFSHIKFNLNDLNLMYFLFVLIFIYSFYITCNFLVVFFLFISVCHGFHLVFNSNFMSS